MSTSSILSGLLFGSIGSGFFIYGKKQQEGVPLVCGLALIILPYFVSSTLVLVLLGVTLMAVPYFMRT
jgi:hypothetical protein